MYFKLSFHHRHPISQLKNELSLTLLDSNYYRSQAPYFRPLSDPRFDGHLTIYYSGIGGQ